MGSLRPPPSSAAIDPGEGATIDADRPRAATSARLRLALLLLLVLGVLALSGCRLDVTADVVVEADGAGTVALVFRLDQSLLDELDVLGVDPTAELTAAVLDDDGWELERTADGDALVITVSSQVTQPEGFGATLRELTSGLADADPALLVDLEVALDDQGGSAVSGSAGFRPPATAGAEIDGEPFGPHGDELTAIVQRSVRPALVLTLPGEVTQTDADQVDGRTMTWELPVDGERAIAARAAPAPWWVVHTTELAIGAAALVLLAMVLLALVLRRRRRRRRAAAATDWV